MYDDHCKHYRGTIADVCAAGVNIRELVGGPDLGWATRLPCIDLAPKNGEKATCELYELPTAEEIAADEEFMHKAIERHLKAMPMIMELKDLRKGQNWQGAVTCPVCGGQLHLSHAAYNGHVWGKCETDGCLSWME